jgi:hypothetical protein
MPPITKKMKDHISIPTEASRKYSSKQKVPRKSSITGLKI